MVFQIYMFLLLHFLVLFFATKNVVESANFMATFPSTVHAGDKAILCIQFFDISQNVRVNISSPENAFTPERIEIS